MREETNKPHTRLIHKTIATLLVGVVFSFSASGQQTIKGIRYTLEDSALGTTLRSIGVELDPHFHAQHIPRSAGAKVQDWDNVIVPRIKKMMPQSFRCMVMPEWYEPQNDDDDPTHINWDALTFESPEMQGLYKVLDLAKEMGVKVTLVPWGARCGSFLAPGPPGWVTVPKYLDEYAENITALMKHLTEKKGYTCIDELTPGNEPDGWGISPSRYIDLCKALQSRLESEGILGKFKLALIDNTDRGGSFDFIDGCATGLQGIADVAVSHTYIFGYETTTETVSEWEANNIHYAKGIPHFVGEFGSNLTKGSSRQTDIDWYKRGVLIVRNAIALLGAGATGISYWQLFDEYYSKGDNYAQMQQLGMWKSVKADYATEDYFDQIAYDYQPRPQYYAYSLLTRFIRPGAKVYPLSSDSTAKQLARNAALAAQNEDGSWIYVVANMEEDLPLSLSLKNSKDKVSGKFERYLYREGHLPADDDMIQADQDLVASRKGKLSETIPANCVVLYRSVKKKNTTR